MARPTKFNPDLARGIVLALLDGRGRRAAARAAGIGTRTLAGWLARGRAGDPQLAEWARAVGEAERIARRRRMVAYWERERVAGRARWERFRATRRAWHLDRLGPCAFWAGRLRWLADRGKDRAFAATVARLEAEGFRIVRTP